MANYLVLLGWSLDDKTEDLSREEMIEHFSLERVNSSGASFDPQKLQAFQQRYMDRLPIKQKTKLALGFLQRAGVVPQPAVLRRRPLPQPHSGGGRRPRQSRRRRAGLRRLLHG